MTQFLVAAIVGLGSFSVAHAQTCEEKASAEVLKVAPQYEFLNAEVYPADLIKQEGGIATYGVQGLDDRYQFEFEVNYVIKGADLCSELKSVEYIGGNF